MDSESFQARLLRVMNEEGITAKEIIRRSGIGENTMSSVLQGNGNKGTYLSTVSRIAQAIGRKPYVICTEDGADLGIESHTPEFYFGHVLKDYRAAHDLTQEELAKKLRVSRRVISQYEDGINRPVLSEMERLCRTLHLFPSYLVES